MPASSAELRGLRAKAKLYDELVQALEHAEAQIEQLASHTAGVDPAWREIAAELAGALRPYSLFREQRVTDGRIIVETAVPGSTLAAAKAALDRLATQLASESRQTAAGRSRHESQPALARCSQVARSHEGSVR